MGGNSKKQREQEREVRVPLMMIFRGDMPRNTITACLWMGTGFVVYYSTFGLFATHLQKTSASVRPWWRYRLPSPTSPALSLAVRGDG